MKLPDIPLSLPAGRMFRGGFFFGCGLVAGMGVLMAASKILDGLLKLAGLE